MLPTKFGGERGLFISMIKCLAVATPLRPQVKHPHANSRAMSTDPPTHAGIAVELDGTLDTIVNDMVKLKENNNISTIIYYLPSIRRYTTSRKCKRSIHALADLLEANHNIKSLKCDSSYKDDFRDTLFASLASGQAGDNLEYLKIRVDSSQTLRQHEMHLLAAYLKRNRNLKLFVLKRIFLEGPAALQLLSALANSSVVKAQLGLTSDFAINMKRELDTVLAHCGSILTLTVVPPLLNEADARLTKSAFKGGLGSLTNLFRLKVEDPGYGAIKPWFVDAIASLIMQNDNLEHFAIRDEYSYGSPADKWKGLHVALRSVKSFKFQVRAFMLVDLLPHLQCCESLELKGMGVESDSSFREIRRHLRGLPNLSSCVVVTEIRYISENGQNCFVDMIKGCASISKVVLKPLVKQDAKAADEPFRAKVESCCIVNRAFGTSLICFGATSLWTRILSKVQDESARSNFLFRLLRDKPECVVGTKPRCSVDCVLDHVSSRTRSTNKRQKLLM